MVWPSGDNAAAIDVPSVTVSRTLVAAGCPLANVAKAIATAARTLRRGCMVLETRGPNSSLPRR